MTYASWAACLHARLERSASARAWLTDEVPKLPSLLARFDEIVPQLYADEPRLVHVD